MPRDSGPSLTADDVLRAYQLGYFPMSEGRDDPDLFWVLPQRRGVLPLDGLHVSHSLRKAIRRAPFEVSIDRDFSAVIRACAAPATGREDTWINNEILELYCELHQRGCAHSVECRQDGALVGGLYGVSLHGAFFGESMFSRVTDASKTALVYLVARLVHGGYRLLDTQFHTEHLGRMGALEIPRTEYERRLKAALAVNGDFYSMPEDASPGSVLATIAQSITHTS